MSKFDLGNVAVLLTAATANDIPTIQKLVDQNFPLNTADYDKRTALHLACSEGHLDLIKYLIDHGSNVNAIDRFGDTPLSCAVWAKQHQVCAFLRENGGRIISREANRDSNIFQLLTAAAKGDAEALSEMLESGMDANSYDYDKRTALHVASSRNHVKLVKILLAKKCIVNPIDVFGQTPLDDALRDGHSEICELLRGSGASEKTSALLLAAAASGDVSKVVSLITNGVNVNTPDYDGRTALHVASAKNQLNVVKYLLEVGADPRALDNFNNTPLDDAARGLSQGGGHAEMHKLLLTAIKTEKAAEPRYQTVPRRFVWTFSLVQIGFIILFGVFVQYGTQSSMEQPIACNGNDAFCSSKDYVQQIYPFYQDVHVMIYVGFGFLMTFLKCYGYSSMGINFLIAVLVTQWYILVDGFFHGVFNKHFGLIYIDVRTLILADFCAASCLISFGALLGKVSAFQMLCIALFEVVFFSVNEQISFLLGISDIGGSMVIHTFGACFGLACSLAQFHGRPECKNHPDAAAGYQSDLFAMIGTIFLFLYWPSFNGALAQGNNQSRAVINTLLALCASTLMAFVTSAMIREGKRFSMVDIQNATISGGVAMGAAADMLVQPFGALLIGFISGTVSVFGYVYILPFLEHRIGLHDTCGILNLHCIPGILGGFASAIASGVSATQWAYIDDAHRAFLWPNVATRSAAQMGGFQVVFLLISIGIGLGGGTMVGLLMRVNWIFLDKDTFFSDEGHWEVAESEAKPIVHSNQTATTTAAPLALSSVELANAAERSRERMLGSLIVDSPNLTSSKKEVHLDAITLLTGSRLDAREPRVAV